MLPAEAFAVVVAAAFAVVVVADAFAVVVAAAAAGEQESWQQACTVEAACCQGLEAADLLFPWADIESGSQAAVQIVQPDAAAAAADVPVAVVDSEGKLAPAAEAVDAVELVESFVQVAFVRLVGEIPVLLLLSVEQELGRKGLEAVERGS